MATLMPVEVLEMIAASIGEVQDLVRFSSTCSRVRQIVLNCDKVWHLRLLKDINVYGEKLEQSVLERLYKISEDLDDDDSRKGICSIPSISPLFHLYQYLYPHKWAKPAIWVGDRRQFGSVVLCQFNYKLLVFEFRECICDKSFNPGPSFTRFSANDLIEIHSYHPRINMDTDPILIVDPKRADYSRPESLTGMNLRAASDDSSRSNNSSRPMLSTSMMRVHPLLASRIHPSMGVWPPLTFPPHLNRVRNTTATGYRGQTAPREPCDDIIRIVRSIRPDRFRFGGVDLIPRLAPPSAVRPNHHPSGSTPTSMSMSMSTSSLAIGFSGLGPIADVVRTETYFRLGADLLMPSPNMPLQGLWLGDIGGRLGELLLFHQPNPNRLEAIKLTADVRVQRGELEFVVEDVGKSLPVSYAEWPDSPVVAAKWQASGLDYFNPHYLDAEIIIISVNCLAYYRSEDDSLVYLRRTVVDFCNGTIGAFDDA